MSERYEVELPILAAVADVAGAPAALLERYIRYLGKPVLDLTPSVVDALETALRRIAGMNDLSHVDNEDDVKYEAIHALYECEGIAREALEVIYRRAPSVPPDIQPVTRYTAWPEVGPFNAYYVGLQEDPDGNLVLYEDHVAALARTPTAPAPDTAVEALRDDEQEPGMLSDEAIPEGVLVEREADRAYAQGRRDAAVEAWTDICEERIRQIHAEGWTAAHDDQHSDGSLLHAAVLYLWHGTDKGTPIDEGVPASWPWDAKWWKPRSRARNLVRAGALCLADHDRRVRAGLPTYPADHKLGLALRELAALSSPALPGVGGVARCHVTGNPVGTDTWREGAPCLCPACIEWLKSEAKP